jgi:hypothetical protein
MNKEKGKRKKVTGKKSKVKVKRKKEKSNGALRISQQLNAESLENVRFY